MHQSRLSFMRVLLRRLASENWKFSRPVWNIDSTGEGHAVYAVMGPARTYSLVAFAHDLPDEMRSDRVIATAWDATFALFDGTPDEGDIARLALNVPRQEAGRVSGRELVLARANRSVRLFDYVRRCLGEGIQPDARELDSVGYLMRTTAVYGSGKFGAADRESICERPELAGPFQVEMLAVYLIRLFTFDIVEHLAQCDSPSTAVKFATTLRETLGVGNSTGLGMAPFLINHPVLINNWITARETAIARVRSLRQAYATEIAIFGDRLRRARLSADLWHTDHPAKSIAVDTLRTDLARLEQHVAAGALASTFPWDVLAVWAGEELSLEGQEAALSLILEPYGALIDSLAETMKADEQAQFPINGAMRLRELKQLIRENYNFAASIDFSQPASQSRIWYTSQEKLEPRLGERSEPVIAGYEQPLGTARDVMALLQCLATWPDEDTVAKLLMAEPGHRHAVRRAQIVQRFPYAEIRDNTVGDGLFPIDLLRCKLSFFGATHFDPKTDRWVRIAMYRGAPTPENLTPLTAEDWVYPRLSAG